MKLDVIAVFFVFAFTCMANSFAYQCPEGRGEAEVIYEYAKEGYSQCKKIGDLEVFTVSMGISTNKIVTTEKQKWECFNSRLNKTESFSILKSFDGWCSIVSVKLNAESIFTDVYFRNLLK